jgi:hypothetical protein
MFLTSWNSIGGLCRIREAFLFAGRRAVAKAPDMP